MDCFNPSSKLIFTCFLIIVVLPDFFMPKKTSEQSALYPSECKTPLPAHSGFEFGECCPDALVFRRDITKTCDKYRVDYLNIQKTTCEYYKCYFGLLGNDVLYEDSSLNMKALIDVLDAWAKVNKKFDPAIRLAKTKCLQNKLKGISDDCPLANVVFCLIASTVMKCPNWNTSIPCSNFKGSLELCEQLYYERLLEHTETMKKWSQANILTQLSAITHLREESEEECEDPGESYPHISQNPAWRKVDNSKENTESEEPVIFI